MRIFHALEVEVVVVLLLVGSVSIGALKHDLKIVNDNRKRFFIENFGFEAGVNFT